MFEHLDDPKPPPPRQLLVELVVAEGARRRRRRATVAGGLAATLLVLAGGVRLAQAAGSGGDPDVRMTPPAESSPDSRGEGGGSGDGLSTTQGPGEGASTTPGETPGEASGGVDPAPSGSTLFAGVTTGDQLVLGDTADGGRVETILVETPTDGTELGDQVALSPDRQTVYYEVRETGSAGDGTGGETGDEAGESAIFKVNTEGELDIDRIDTGSSPALSRDGKQLAYVQTSEAGNEVIVRDVSGADTPARRFQSSDTGSTIGDLAFVDDDESLVFVKTSPEGARAVYVIDVNFSLSVSTGLGAASELRPTEEATGTSWSSPDARGTDDTIAVVQTCCALESDGETTFAFVDPDTFEPTGELPADGVSGTVHQSSYDETGQSQLVITVDDGGGHNLYLRQGDGPLERLDEGGTFRAVDW